MSQYRKSQSFNIKFFIIILFCIFAFVFLFSYIRDFRSAQIPFYGDSVSLSLNSKQSLVKKVLELQTQLDAQNASLTNLSALEKENQTLKSELARPNTIKGVLARVIVPPNRSIYDTMIIDAGNNQNISVDQKVYGFGSIALGSISEVLENSSVVLLYSSPNKETVGSIVGSDLSVTLIGRGSGEYEVRMPRDIVFSQGDTIVDQSLTPHSLAIIQKIVTDPRDPFQRLLAKAPVNLQTLKWVVVK